MRKILIIISFIVSRVKSIQVFSSLVLLTREVIMTDDDGSYC